MTVNDYLASIIKRPVQKGATVYVFDGNDKLIERHSAIELGKAYFSMSNDTFYNIYGFNFVPEGVYWEISKRAAGKL